MIEIIGVILVVFLIVTVLIYVIISGLLEPIVVKTRENYKCKGFYAFKAHTDYSYAGPCFTEVHSINPELACFAIYYDDPKRVSKEKCRYTVGALIGEDIEVEKRERIFSTFRSHGYSIKEVNDVGQAVYCSFPHVTQLSVNLSIARVYPEMSEYILKRRLDARLFMEHYADGVIHFIAPLERHDDFMMPGIEGLAESQAEVPVAESAVETSNTAPDECLPAIDEDLPASNVQTKKDEDSASSASSFEEVQQEDCGANGDQMVS